MSERGLEHTVANVLKNAVDRTNADLMRWAEGQDNTGHLAQEAHHICVHITAALRLLELNFRSALANQKGQDHE